ncbi:MAG: DUF4157 domain-containing protein [Spirochaetia bacterium]|jgi:hypothetical protein|nr:DUF4157 domain-containing protein [Spirochaetia bacterium]
MKAFEAPAKKPPRPLPKDDRVFPLETVSIQGFRLEHGRDLRFATLHTGAFADGFARSHNAVALTLAADIYFRAGAWNPSSEEGRKLLAHELTHVAQHQENRSLPSSREELEAEAGREEASAAMPDDPLVALSPGGEVFRIRASRFPAAAKMAADDIRSWLEEQKAFLDEADYLKLLCSLDGFSRRPF